MTSCLTIFSQEVGAKRRPLKCFGLDNAEFRFDSMQQSWLTIRYMTKPLRTITSMLKIF